MSQSKKSVRRDVNNVLRSELSSLHSKVDIVNDLNMNPNPKYFNLKIFKQL